MGVRHGSGMLYRYLAGEAVKKKQKKIAGLGAGALIAALIACVFLVGLMFWQFSSPVKSFENQGDVSFEKGDYAGALHLWRTVVNYTGGSEHLYKKLGMAHLKLSHLDQAEACFEKALAKSPEDIEVQKELIQIALIKGDLGKAENMLFALMADHNANTTLLTLSGDLFMFRGKFEKAQAEYTKAVRLSGGLIRIKLKQAICFFEQGNRIKAEKLVAQCLGDGIKAAMDLMLLADYYILDEKDAKAEWAILGAIDADPGNLEIKIRLCRFYRLIGFKKKAAAYLAQLARDYPDNPDFKVELADVYLSLQNMVDAESLMDALTPMEEKVFGYHLVMGKYWLLKGMYSHAVSYLKTALEKNYGLVSAHFMLGVAYLAGGQAKLAEKSPDGCPNVRTRS